MKRRVISFLLCAILIACVIPVPGAWAASPATTPTPTSAPPQNGQSYNGHTYQLFDTSMNWNDAKAYAEDLGGHLATITSAEEQAFIESLIANGEKLNYWLGGTDTSGSWQWVTGESFGYANWSPGEPRGHSGSDYLHIMAAQTPYSGGNSIFKWNDVAVDGIYPGEEDFFGTDKYGLICEWDNAADTPTPTATPTQTPKSTPAPTPTPYTPVSSDAPSLWAQDSVNTSIGLGLVPGSQQSNYTATMNRVNFCALVVALYEKVAGGEITGRIPFTDTSDVNVEKTAYIGVTSGVGSGIFDPYGTLNREQAATMLSRLANAIGKPFAGGPATFSDISSASDFAKVPIGQVQSLGIMTGVDATRFDPKGPYTREQSIATMLRMYNYVGGESGTPAASATSVPTTPTAPAADAAGTLLDTYGTMSEGNNWHVYSFTLNSAANIQPYVSANTEPTGDPFVIEWILNVESSGGQGFTLHSTDIEWEMHQGQTSWHIDAQYLPAGDYTLGISAPEYLFSDEDAYGEPESNGYSYEWSLSLVTAAD